MKLAFLLLFTLALLTSPSRANETLENAEFWKLTSLDGLCNSQVNAIMKDEKGLMWFGTQSGLARFDGFRFKNFFFNENDQTSLNNNTIDELQQDIDGDIWVRTAMGYCIYNYQMERFDRNPADWMQSVGMRGTPNRMFIDRDKNMWFFVYGKGCYFYEPRKKRHCFFRQGGNSGKALPQGEVTHFAQAKEGVVMTFRDGTLACLNGKNRKMIWLTRKIKDMTHGSPESYKTYIDSKGNIWEISNQNSFVYEKAKGQWHRSIFNFLRAQGYDVPKDPVFIKDIKEDRLGRLWIATDHKGLYVLRQSDKATSHFMHDPLKTGSIADNTLQNIFIDENLGVWIGTYKNGIDYYSTYRTHFSTISLGDICTITADKAGRLWCGTNDNGIVCYDPRTGQTLNFHNQQTGLGTDVVVSSLCASDGTLYFGTFNGGMTIYKDGRWKAIRASKATGGLASDNVWALMEDRLHHIVIGTLGAGMQIYEPMTGRFTTFDIEKSGLSSDYINSLSSTLNGDILMGTSSNYTVMNPLTLHFTNHNTTRAGTPFTDPSVNMIAMDSRGIIWMATASGIVMYDPKSGMQQNINALTGNQGAMGCSVIEDKQHQVWLIFDHQVSCVVVKKNAEGKWDLFITNYNYIDGLQSRQFNYRAAFLTDDGTIVIGGQDGINLIFPEAIAKHKDPSAEAIFSGLELFGQPVNAGESYNGRVIYEQSLDRSRKLVLRNDENAFTIQLASTQIQVPCRKRFLYRLKGMSDKWMMTPDSRPSVTFTNISYGHYTLQVKVVNDNGTLNNRVSEMEIIIRPPFYLSTWAILIYLLALGIAIYAYRQRSLAKQRHEFEMQRIEEEARRTKELDEAKLNFFTNISHELRTPLSLIISPISALIKKEDDKGKKRKLEMIFRNAQHLLQLVNQILDFRKMDGKNYNLNTTSGDIITVLRAICDSFKTLSEKNITLSFFSSVPSLVMRFDAEKVGQIMNNLLSNAFKFTPEGGKVDVQVRTLRKEEKTGHGASELEISVADSGRGISDENKKHVFERFFQVDADEIQRYGGSGIGLNMVKTFTELHGGKVAVMDNPMGGSIFKVYLPIHQDKAAPSPLTASKPNETASEAPSGKCDNTCEQPAQVPRQHGKHSAMAANDHRPLVLLVDDSDDFRSFMNDFLCGQYRVVDATNGKEGLDKARKLHPDIVLSDVMMPVMDGNAFCKAMKDDSRTADIPFVMLTARMTDQQRLEGLQNGADEYITKPFDLDLLVLRIKNLVKRFKKNATPDLPTPPGSTSAQASATDPTPPTAPSHQQEAKLSPADQRFVDQAENFVMSHIGDAKLSVETLSSALGISRVQLYKRMVSLTGTTPSEYIRYLRLRRAEAYLSDGDLPITEIAYRVGFNSPRYFTKYFAEAYGCTPSQYKKKRKEEE